MNPLVSIICIAYNHAPYLLEALDSVFAQTYENLEIIVLDDASADSSQETIKKRLQGKNSVRFVAHDKNHGYTATFNEGLKLSTGEFIVDFALDDVMHPEFISKSVSGLINVGDDFGVSFCNASYINARSEVIGDHNEHLIEQGLIRNVPQGDVFEMILRRYFICTPTMLMRRSVLKRLDGYDTNLTYEDFDFWLRSSRFTGYLFIDEVLMQKRKLSSSMSASQYNSKDNRQLESTLKVCEKAVHLVKSKTERTALNERLEFELRHCITSRDFNLGQRFYELLKSQKGSPFRLFVYKALLLSKMDYSFLNKNRKRSIATF